MAEAKSIEQEMTEALTSGGSDEGSVDVSKDGGGTTDAAGGEAAKAADTAKTEGDVGSGERARDEQGRFVKQDKPAGEAETATGEAAPKAGEGEAAKPEGEVAANDASFQGGEPAKPPATGEAEAPPSTWRPLAKAEWARLPATVREEIKKREGDFQKGIEQFKGAAEFGRSLYEVIRPFEAHLQAEGAKPHEAIRNILEITQRLRSGNPQEKVGTLLWLGQQYGVDLSTAIGATQEQTDDMSAHVQRAMAPFMQQFESFRQSQEQAKHQQQEQMRKQLQQAVEEFKTATDDKGRLKHVYFEDVKGLMGPLLTSGTVRSWDQAYEMACRAHPEVSAALSAEQRKTEEARRLEDQRKKAEDAKRAAAANATGQGGVGMADTRKLSVEDELAARMKGQRI